MNEIAKKLNKYFMESEISYAELAKRTGIPKSALQRYIVGQTDKIPIDRLHVFMGVLLFVAIFNRTSTARSRRRSRHELLPSPPRRSDRTRGSRKNTYCGNPSSNSPDSPRSAGRTAA